MPDLQGSVDEVEEPLGGLGDVAGLEQEHRALLPILLTLPSAGIRVRVGAHLSQTDAQTRGRGEGGGQGGDGGAL